MNPCAADKNDQLSSPTHAGFTGSNADHDTENSSLVSVYLLATRRSDHLQHANTHSCDTFENSPSPDRCFGSHHMLYQTPTLILGLSKARPLYDSRQESTSPFSAWRISRHAYPAFRILCISLSDPVSMASPSSKGSQATQKGFEDQGFRERKRKGDSEDAGTLIRESQKHVNTTCHRSSEGRQ